MKTSYLKITGLIMTALIIGFTSCKKDEETKAAPTVTSPASTTVEKGLAVDLIFNYSAEAGFM